MIAEVRLRTDRHAAMLIPLEALAGGERVFVVDAAHRAQVKAVVLGEIRGDQVEVVQGIAPGDRVVVKGSAYLRDGDQVRMVE